MELHLRIQIRENLILTGAEVGLTSCESQSRKQRREKRDSPSLLLPHHSSRPPARPLPKWPMSVRVRDFLLRQDKEGLGDGHLAAPGEGPVRVGKPALSARTGADTARGLQLP